jgi:hypothetical protein
MVIPVPAAVLTVMLCDPVVALCTMYGFSVVGTINSLVAVKDTADVTYR